MYYFMIKFKVITNINQIAKSQRQKVTAYIKDYGYTVESDGTITKTEQRKMKERGFTNGNYSLLLLRNR